MLSFLVVTSKKYAHLPLMKVKKIFGYLLCFTSGAASVLFSFNISANASESQKMGIMFDFSVTIVQDLTITPLLTIIIQFICYNIVIKKKGSFKFRRFVHRRILDQDFLRLHNPELCPEEKRKLKRIRLVPKTIAKKSVSFE